MHRRLKHRIPVQNIDLEAVNCLQADIGIRLLLPEPLRGIPFHRTIDDVADAVVAHEAMC
jgi:hypothetical protein